MINLIRKHAVRLFIWAILVAIFVGLLVYPPVVATAARTALDISARRIIPILFPFFVLTQIAMETGLTAVIGRVLAKPMTKIFALPPQAGAVLVMGMIAGFPVGAKCAATLVEKSEISRKDGERLCALSSICSPAFLVAFVGVGIVGNALAGVVIYASHVASMVIFALCTRPREKIPVGAGFYARPWATARVAPTATKRFYMPKLSLNSISTAISSAAGATIAICATVIFFGIVSGVALHVIGGQGSMGSVVLMGLLEMVGGVTAVGTTEFFLVPFFVPLTLITGWGGLAVHMQVALVTSGAQLNLRQYFVAKIIAPMIAAILVMSFYVMLVVVSVWRYGMF